VKKNYLGALDIGSQHITFLLGEATHQQLNLIGHAQTNAAGVLKGQIKDSKALMQVLSDFFENLSQRYSILPDVLCLTQSGSHLRNMQYETSLSLKGFQHVVDNTDIEKINQLALHKELPEGEVFLHHARQFYTINDDVVENPLGHAASQLNVYYNALLGKTQFIKEQLYLVNQFGFRVKNLVFSGIASALATTTAIEREHGVCVINLGAQMTEFVVYKHQIPIIMGTIPVGGQNFTYDLCSGLRIHEEDAERLKFEHGIPSMEYDKNEEDIWVLGNHSIGDKKIKLKNFRLIVQARAQELFDYIYKFIKAEENEQLLLSGVVLTGGGALMKNIEKVASQSFKCDCFVRGALASVDEALKSPIYANCFGLLHYALQQDKQTTAHTPQSSFWQRVTSWFSKN